MALSPEPTGKPKPPSKGRRQRSASRFYAVQALFQMEASETPLNEVEAEFETHRIGAEADGIAWVEADRAHFRKLLRASIENQARIDQIADRALVAKWPLGRIDPTLRAVFRAAGAEFIAFDTPPKVAITEFVEVAKAFFPDGKEPKFVNAVLDHMAREARPESFKG
ncbi:transcription antitermination factor NusB [Amaricoccus macauensis]|uniref:transcription antitermination factor NusB n=1 Tax=Amaricoccus macauensis TaxID=57001 RepID=UPI003C7BB9F9